MRFNRRFKWQPRGVTLRRLASAERALKNQRDKLPLFADQIALEQPSALQRVQLADDATMRYEISSRDYNAELWRKSRKALYSVDIEVRRLLLKLWNGKRGYPGTPVYFADFLFTTYKHLRYRFDPLFQGSMPESFSYVLSWLDYSFNVTVVFYRLSPFKTVGWFITEFGDFLLEFSSENEFFDDCLVMLKLSEVSITFSGLYEVQPSISEQDVLSV